MLTEVWSFVKKSYTHNMGLKFGKLRRKSGELAALLCVTSGRVVEVLDLQSTGRVFKSQPSQDSWYQPMGHHPLVGTKSLVTAWI